MSRQGGGQVQLVGEGQVSELMGGGQVQPEGGQVSEPTGGGQVQPGGVRSVSQGGGSGPASRGEGVSILRSLAGGMPLAFTQEVFLVIKSKNI